jgi:hypothetical protein
MGECDDFVDTELPFVNHGAAGGRIRCHRVDASQHRTPKWRA